MRTNIIVTVKTEDPRVPDYDMEIPTGTDFRKLSSDMIGLMAQVKPEEAGNLSKLKGTLYCERLNRTLRGDETPAGVGLWNGDILRIS